MNWDAVGAVAEAVGALGVILTLGFLALQIRANTRATKTSTFDSILAEMRAKQRGVFAANPESMNVWIHGMHDVDALSPEQKRMFAMLMSDDALYVENIIQHYRSNNIDYAQLEPWLDYLSNILRTPGGHKWWSESAWAFNPVLQEVVNEHLLKTQGARTMLDNKYWAAEYATDTSDQHPQ